MWTKLEQLGQRILERLEAAGFEAYFVGGYVRDKTLGKPVKDMDIATSAVPDEVVRLFEKTVPTGLQHGTVTVMLEGIPFEVTTFRTESGYEDFRRPSEVRFIRELNEDLRRRDFTMNAMAMDRHGNVKDPFGGKEDLERKLLRCVGDPEERFQEDALRMLRCVRFASAYSLEVDGATWQAVLHKKELLRHVAMERVRVELERTISGSDPVRGIRLLAESGLLGRTKEPLEWIYAHQTPDELPMAALEATTRLDEPLRRWILLADAAGMHAEAVRGLLRVLTFSVKDTERIAKAVEVSVWAGVNRTRPLPAEQDDLTGCGKADLLKLAVLRYGPDAVRDWIAVAAARGETEGSLPEGTEEWVRQGEEWLAEMPAVNVKELAAAGQDLIRHTGRKPGPWVSAELGRLLRLAALGRIPNTKEALLSEVR